MSHPDAWDLYDWDESEYLATLMDEQSRDSVRMYLAVYGDAIEARVRECLANARDLAANGQFGLSLIRSATASELIIGYLVVRPLVQGAFMLEQCSGILTDRIIHASRRNDRELLPPLVRQWGIDLDGLLLPAGSPLWQRLVEKEGLWANRGAYLHTSRSVSEDAAQQGIEAVELLLSGLVEPLALQFQLSWPSTPWHSTAFPTLTRTTEPRDPIGERS